MVFILAIEIKDVLRIIDITDFFSRALRERKIGKILELLQLLASSGVISNEELTELSIELMELSKLEGEEFKEKAKEIEKRIEKYVRGNRRALHR